MTLLLSALATLFLLACFGAVFAIGWKVGRAPEERRKRLIAQHSVCLMCGGTGCCDYTRSELVREMSAGA